VATGLPVATAFHGWSGERIRPLIWASLLLPLLLIADFFFPYVTTRALFFRAMVELSVGAVFYGFIRHRQHPAFARDPLFLALLAFVAASSLSALLSPAPIRSFYGSFERMGGVWAWLHWLLYYALLRTVLDESSWTFFFRVGVAVSGIVSLIGLKEAYGFLSTSNGTLPAVASTMGNSGLLGGYLLFGIVFALLLAVRRDRYRMAYLATAGLDLVVIILSQNRSTLIGIVLGLLSGAAVYLAVRRGAVAKWALVASCALAAVVIAPVIIERLAPQGRIAKLLPGAFQRVGATRLTGSDASRIIQWRAAIKGFEEHPFLGVGPENHRLTWSKHFDPRALQIDPAAFYDRPHNAFLEVPETTGILGAVTFAALWVGLFAGIRRAWRRGSLSGGEVAVLVGAQVAYAVYLFFWFTDVNSTPLWIALAAFIGTRSVGVPLFSADKLRKASGLAVVGYSVGILAVFGALYLHVIEPLRVANALNLGRSYGVPLKAGLGAIDVAFNSPGPLKSDAVMVSGGYLSSLSPRFRALRANRSDSARLDLAFATAISGSYREVLRDSLDDHLRIEYARLLLVAAHFYENPDYSRAALSQIQRAIELSPNRMTNRIILANVLAQMGYYPRALATARTAVEIDPALGQAHYEDARIYLLAGQPDSAAAELLRSLELKFAIESDVYLKTGAQLEEGGREPVAAQLYTEYLEARFGNRVWTGKPHFSFRAKGPDIRVAAHLPILLLEMNDLDRARQSANALIALDSTHRKLVVRFASDLRAGDIQRWRGRYSLLGCPDYAGAAGEPRTLSECEHFNVSPAGTSQVRR